MEQDVKEALKEIKGTILTLVDAMKKIEDLIEKIEDVRHEHTNNIYNTFKLYNKVLEDIIDPRESKKLEKELKEIENTISIGVPGWIKYTRRAKKTKK